MVRGGAKIVTHLLVLIWVGGRDRDVYKRWERSRGKDNHEIKVVPLSFDQVTLEVQLPKKKIFGLGLSQHLGFDAPLFDPPDLPALPMPLNLALLVSLA